MAESAKEQLHIDRCSDSLVASAIPHQSYRLFLIGGFEQTFSPSPSGPPWWLLKYRAYTNYAPGSPRDGSRADSPNRQQRQVVEAHSTLFEGA